MNESVKGVMTHSVCQQSRGIPQFIVQDAVTEKMELLRHRGTIKADVLTGYPKCKYLVVVSMYDTKPVYLLSNACKNIQWRKKERKLWHNDKGKKVDAPFYRLNLIDEYNMGMGNVDQAVKGCIYLFTLFIMPQFSFFLRQLDILASIL